MLKYYSILLVLFFPLFFPMSSRAILTLPHEGEGIREIILQTDSKVDVIDTEILQLSLCGVTPITVQSTTISQSGNYCLAQDITGPILIDASCVDLDLNGHKVSMISTGAGIEITRDQTSVAIRNGKIRGFETGIMVNPGGVFDS